MNGGTRPEIDERTWKAMKRNMMIFIISLIGCGKDRKMGVWGDMYFLTGCGLSFLTQDPWWMLAMRDLMRLLNGKIIKNEIEQSILSSVPRPIL